MTNNVLTIKEQKTLQLDVGSKDHVDLSLLLNHDSYDPTSPEQLLGLDWSNRSHSVLQAKYFIGLKWIKEDESAIYVEPKIPELDFMSMFMHCFSHECQDISSKLGRIYGIDFDKKPIKVESDCIELTPILIIHFLKLTQRIVQRGLKYNYIQQEENFSTKIKGKVLLSQTIKRNYSCGRMDRTVCRFQNYSTDCFENRVLKKTLLFVVKFIETNPSIRYHKDLKRMSTYCLGAMTSVGSEIPLQQVKQFKINPLYKEYAEALRVAKLILKRFSYNIELVKKDAGRILPPFWINMSLLFELYVYGHLKKAYGHQIHHHLSTHGSEIDFVKFDEELIIDTKYIPQWENKVYHDNVRQLSGYARSLSLRKRILNRELDDTTIINCLVVYPNKDGCVQFNKDENLIDCKTSIKEYLKFHKLSIQLPIKNHVTKSNTNSHRSSQNSIR